MKILEIIPSLHSAGAERLVVELSNELNNRKGVEVTLLQLYPFRETDILRQFLDSSIKVYSLKKPMGFSASCLWKLLKFIKNGHYDVVHSHTSVTSYLILPALIYRRPLYCATIHSEARREAGGRVKSMVKKCLFKTGLCQPVTISEKSNESFVDYYHMGAPIIYNGIKRYSSLPILNKLQSKGSIVFVHIARVHKIKNQIILYNCINRLAKEGFNVKLRHYGRFSDEELSEKLRSIKSDNIQICGETDNPQEVLLNADALCMSSLMEGMPMTIIEAFSVGCPVISTPVGGCSNMVHDGENGILSEDTDEESYYKAMRRFLSLKEDSVIEMRQNALKSFEKYDIRTTADNYLKLFDNNKR